MRPFLPTVVLAMLLFGCTDVTQQLNREGKLIDSRSTNWRVIVTVADRVKLRDWRTSFVAALKEARASGNGTKIDAEGMLLQPDAALPKPTIPAGSYACRTIKLGAKQPGTLEYLAYPTFNCRVSGGQVQALVKVSGSQRPVGVIYPDDPLRSVFLGTLMLGDENRTMQYGGDTDRDMAGYVERIGPQRWRLILPRPAFESKMDVIELVPEPGS